MRLVLLAAALGLLVTTAATACPREVACVLMRASAAPGLGEVAGPQRTARTVSLQLAAPETPELTSTVSLRFSEPSPAADDLTEMPWIWVVLKREVHQRMPRYEQEREFSVMLSPVVVAGSFDTVPGLGVAGDF